jgi:hypothetical protein
MRAGSAERVGARPSSITRSALGSELFAASASSRHSSARGRRVSAALWAVLR